MGNYLYTSDEPVLVLEANTTLVGVVVAMVLLVFVHKNDGFEIERATKKRAHDFLVDACGEKQQIVSFHLFGCYIVEPM